MPKTNELLAANGATFTNFFVHTPICNPSRSETLTGRMFHNLKQTGQFGPNIWGMHVNETKVFDHSFVRSLKEDAGYTTGHFGKYLNIMPSDFDLGAPAGYDAWLANPGGDYVQPSFDTEGISDLGYDDGSWDGTSDDYSTAVIGNVSVAWIRKVVNEDPTRPFFAYIAPKAAHEPFMPAPWYADAWDPSWPSTEPRDNPAWNASYDARANHPSDIASNPMLSETAATLITDIFKNRWRTLMSVDDVISAVYTECTNLGVVENTYFLFTSDHGFQLGQFNMVMDKRRVYDWDTRVHLLVAGPGILPGTIVEQPAMNIDLAPTIIELAGVTEITADLAEFDGHSIVPLLVDGHSRASEVAASWRDTVFFEYYFVNENAKCVQNCTTDYYYPDEESECGDLSVQPNGDCWGGCDIDCYPTESTQNNFIALRKMDSKGTLYVEYQNGTQNDGLDFDSVDFFELYQCANDAWHIDNVYAQIVDAEPETVEGLSDEVHAWYKCAGSACP